MLQSASLVNVVNKTLPYKSLGDSFLPVNNNAEFMSLSNSTTVTIRDSEQVVAFGSIVKCSEKQAYVMVGEVAKNYQDKSVWIEKEDADEANKLNIVYKITKCIPRVDYSGETHFEQSFANRDEKLVHLHLLDSLIENSVGLLAMDVYKNITVDFEKYDNIDSWRDVAGFVVTDRNSYQRITVQRFELLALEPENESLTVEKINIEKLGLIFDYDAEVSLFNREDFLTSLLKTGNVSAQVAKVGLEPVGYVVYTNSTILQCYGDDENIQKSLLAAAAVGMSPNINMCVRKESNKMMDELAEKSLENVPITRLNTRVVVNTIKWNKVACLNMGLHLF